MRLVNRTSYLLVFAFVSLAWSQSVPWPQGEKLIYQLSWQGVGLGKFYLNAELSGSGWRFKGKLESEGIASLLGYSLEAESQTGDDFYTDRFWQNISEPARGTTRLTFERQENNGSWAKVTNPDGKQTTWSNGSEQVLDSLSVIYFVRIHPEARQLNLVDYPKLAQGTLEFLGKNGEGSGYRFAREGLLVEVWYRSDVARTPIKIIFGRDFGRVEATLIVNGK